MPATVAPLAAPPPRPRSADAAGPAGSGGPLAGAAAPEARRGRAPAGPRRPRPRPGARPGAAQPPVPQGPARCRSPVGSGGLSRQAFQIRWLQRWFAHLAPFRVAGVPGVWCDSANDTAPPPHFNPLGPTTVGPWISGLSLSLSSFTVYFLYEVAHPKLCQRAFWSVHIFERIDVLVLTSGGPFISKKSAYWVMERPLDQFPLVPKACLHLIRFPARHIEQTQSKRIICSILSEKRLVLFILCLRWHVGSKSIRR